MQMLSKISASVVGKGEMRDAGVVQDLPAPPTLLNAARKTGRVAVAPHFTADSLRAVFNKVNKDACPGADGVSVRLLHQL